MNEQATPSENGVALRVLRRIAGIMLSPAIAYFLAYVIFNVIDLFRGQPWHLFRPWFGIGFFSMISHGHQWSPRTIILFYVICLLIVLPLIVLLRFRAMRHPLLASSFSWGIASAIYFLFIDTPFGVSWRFAVCGAIAGTVAGLAYYFTAYAPIRRND